QSNQPLHARVGRGWSTAYEKLPLLQMNHHLRITTLRTAGFVSPPAAALFHSVLILFGATIAWSISAAPVAKEQDRASAAAQIRSVLRA
ncbi:MAG: hypothetical protein DME75_01340, partial [Verrucomicrobia bacterium]